MVSTSPSLHLYFYPGGSTMWDYQSSKTGKREARTLGSPSEKFSALDTYINPFHTRSEAGSFEVSFWSQGTEPGIGTFVIGCPQSSSCLWWVGFHILAECKSLLFSFQIFHQGNVPVNFCWIGMFVGKRRVQGLPTLLWYLADVTTVKVFSLFQFHIYWGNTKALHKSRVLHCNRRQCKPCPL